jgi:hypothetical protein
MTGYETATQRPNRWIPATAALLLIAAIKTPPLYHSNQNTKFLHGLAQAFPDLLGGDWTAATRDGLPVFSDLVYAVAKFGDVLIFHVLEAALLAVLAVALVAVGAGIARQPSPRLKLALAVTFATVAALNGFDGVAGQYLFNGYLQPSEFGVLFVAAVALAQRGRCDLAALAAAVPAALHPAYIPIAVLVVGAVWWARRREANSWPPLVVAVAVLALLVVPEVDLALRFKPTDAATFALANQILTVERIPHHAIPALWFNLGAVVKLVLALAAFVLAPSGMVRAVLAALLAYAVLGTLAVVVTGYEGLMLLAPWRGSVVIVPLAIAVLAARAWEWLLPRADGRRARLGFAVAMAAISVGVVVKGSLAKVKVFREARPPDYVRFIREHRVPGALYLTDPALHTFRLAAMVPQLVSWKSHPYLDVEVLEWRRRIDLANAVFGEADQPPKFDCDALRTLLRAYPVTDVVREAPVIANPAGCPFLAPVFSGRDGAVFRVDRAGL